MQVLIVTGGDTGYPDYLELSSTETWTRSSTRWTPAADLPSPRHSLRGVSFGGHFIVTGEHIAILTHSIKVLLLCDIQAEGIMAAASIIAALPPSTLMF